MTVVIDVKGVWPLSCPTQLLGAAVTLDIARIFHAFHSWVRIASKLHFYSCRLKRYQRGSKALATNAFHYLVQAASVLFNLGSGEVNLLSETQEPNRFNRPVQPILAHCCYLTCAKICCTLLSNECSSRHRSQFVGHRPLLAVASESLELSTQTNPYAKRSVLENRKTLILVIAPIYV